jgi:outer membrane biosynthesis protein TonB
VRLCYLAIVRALLCVLALAGTAHSAQVPPPDGILRIGPGVKPPILTYKEEPAYTEEARQAHIQGNVLLGLVVDDNGRATDVTVLSPLGLFG